MSSESNKALQWIQLELIPLPNFAEQYVATVAWWNPETGELLGEQAEILVALIEAAKQEGAVVSPAIGTFEVTDPLRKPTELAAILGQYFWVLPQPVEKPYQLSSSIEPLENNPPPSTLQ